MSLNLNEIPGDLEWSVFKRRSQINRKARLADKKTALLPVRENLQDEAAALQIASVKPLAGTAAN